MVVLVSKCPVQSTVSSTCPEKRGNVVTVQRWIVFCCRNDQEFGQAGFAQSPEYGRGRGQNLFRYALAEGHVALVADGQKEGVYRAASTA